MTDKTLLPQHVGIIMDGNGRWAKKRGLPNNAGHKKGAEVFENISRHCRGLRYMRSLQKTGAAQKMRLTAL